MRLRQIRASVLVTTVMVMCCALLAFSLWPREAAAQQQPPKKEQPAKAAAKPAPAKETKASPKEPAAQGQSEKKPPAQDGGDKAAPAKADAPAQSAGAKSAPSKAASPPAQAKAGSAQPAAAPAGSANTAAAPAAVDAATYTVRLRDLESRVDELKEQIRRSHTRLSLLSETVLSGGIGGANAEVAFRNDLSNAFRVTSILVVLDGAVQYKKQDDTGALSNQKSIPIFSGAVPPGDHTIQVVLGLQGHGYGVFSYLRKFKWKPKSTHSFTVTEGKTAQVEIIVYEKGDATTPLEERPTVRFSAKILNREQARKAKKSGAK